MVQMFCRELWATRANSRAELREGRRLARRESASMHEFGQGDDKIEGDVRPFALARAQILGVSEVIGFPEMTRKRACNPY